MEHISATASELTKRSLPSQPTSTKTIPREVHAALFTIINKSRLLNGWTTRTAQELDPTIKAWAEMFASYDIPIDAYPELYHRAFDVRQQRMQTGGDVPSMDATLLVSQWTGAFGLKADLKQREIDRGRTLGENAESVCRHCHGSGFREVEGFDYQGGYKFTQRCDHTD